jgi:hypothetical protein
MIKNKSLHSSTMVYKYYGKYKEKFEDRKGVNRSRKWKDRQTMDKRKRTEGQNTTLNIKDRAKRTPLKTGGDLVCSGRVSSWSSWRYLLTIFFRQF